MTIPILGLRITRRVLVLALVLLVAYRCYRHGRAGLLPNFTFRQRSEP